MIINELHIWQDTGWKVKLLVSELSCRQVLDVTDRRWPSRAISRASDGKPARQKHPAVQKQSISITCFLPEGQAMNAMQLSWALSVAWRQ